MSIVDDGSRFVPMSCLPVRPLLSTLHNIDNAIAESRRSGVVLTDDLEPAYMLTSHFVRASILLTAGEEPWQRKLEAAALTPVTSLIHRWLTTTDYQAVYLEGFVDKGAPMVLSISPHAVGASMDVEALHGRYDMYPVSGTTPSRSGWYFRSAEICQGTLVPDPEHYVCDKGHTHNSFDRGRCRLGSPPCGADIRPRR